MNVLGVAAFYHESACCLLQEGKLAAAAAEERFSRLKHDPSLPVDAYRFCLDSAGLLPSDIDCVAYYETPDLKLERQLATGVVSDLTASSLDPRFDARRPERAIRDYLGFDGKVLIYRHHHSHAASAFFFSGFEDAAILTLDGVGEWATTTYGQGHGTGIDLFEEVRFPHSLGLLYATLTSFLGFRVNGGEYKVMGLAAHGRPRWTGEVRRLVSSGAEGAFALAMEYFDFSGTGPMFRPALIELFGNSPRPPESEITGFHCDLARSLQAVLEEIMLEKVAYLAARTASRNLCLAGGVALNCVAVGRLARESAYERIFAQPAAGDAGGCLGAAALAHVELTGERPDPNPMESVFVGPAQTPGGVDRLLRATELPAQDFRGREPALLEAVVDRLVEGGAVGWFHGPMEFGPRALGGRSILADPRNPRMRDRLNRAIKEREDFRPFAPSVLAGYARDHFDLDHPSPFMLEACAVRSPLDLPAITHVDGSARPQTVDPEHCPRFAALIESFRRRTGCPILLNTSLNRRGEPMAHDAVDALVCFARSGLDALVLDDFLVDREALPGHWEELLASWRGRSRSLFHRHREAGRSPLGEALYTFV